MNRWIFYIFELVTFAYLFVMARHAWRSTRGLPLFGHGRETVAAGDEANRGRWLSTLLWGVFFGFVIEIVLTKYSTYTYSELFLINPKNPLCPAKHVPLCIGVGWGIIIYATTWTAQRLKLPPLARACYAGVLAVGIDLALDPAASVFGFWSWPNVECYPPYFDVPFDNFIGWFLIVSIYSGGVRYLFRLIGSKFLSVVWVPAVTAAPTIGLVFLVDEYVLPRLYELTNGDLLPFTALFGAVLWFIARESRRRPFPRNLEPSWPILAVPVLFAGLSWFGLFLSRCHTDLGCSSLMLAVPLALTVSFMGFAWGSLNMLFPREVEANR